MAPLLVAELAAVASGQILRTLARRATIGSADPADPRFTVANAKLDGLPPLLVQVGSVELLDDQVLRFVESARHAGVDVSVEVLPEMFHDVHLQAGLLPEGAAAVAAVAKFLRQRLDR